MKTKILPSSLNQITVDEGDIGDGTRSVGATGRRDFLSEPIARFGGDLCLPSSCESST